MSLWLCGVGSCACDTAAGDRNTPATNSYPGIITAQSSLGKWAVQRQSSVYRKITNERNDLVSTILRITPTTRQPNPHPEYYAPADPPDDDHGKFTGVLLNSTHHTVSISHEMNKLGGGSMLGVDALTCDVVSNDNLALFTRKVTPGRSTTVWPL